MTAGPTFGRGVARARSAPRRSGERGQTSLLILGFVLVIAMMIVVVVDASSAYLRRQALNTLADGAALAAADGIQGEQVYTVGLGEGAAVDPRAARELVVAYLASVDAGERYPGLAHDVATDGEHVVVHLGAPLDLPLPLPGVASEVRVTATAAAVVVLVE